MVNCIKKEPKWEPKAIEIWKKKQEDGSSLPWSAKIGAKVGEGWPRGGVAGDRERGLPNMPGPRGCIYILDIRVNIDILRPAASSLRQTCS